MMAPPPATFADHFIINIFYFDTIYDNKINSEATMVGDGKYDGASACCHRRPFYHKYILF